MSIGTPAHTVDDPHSQDLHISVRLISQYLLQKGTKSN
jgi:hypothetical protein